VVLVLEVLGFLSLLLLGLQSLLKHIPPVLHAAREVYLEIESWKAKEPETSSPDPPNNIRRLSPKPSALARKDQPQTARPRLARHESSTDDEAVQKPPRRIHTPIPQA
jgi:hypothetical protein